MRKGDDPEASPTKLAIILSLPVAFLLWSVLALVFAVVWYAASTTSLASKTLVGSITGVLFILGLFSLWYFWGASPEPFAESGPESTQVVPGSVV